MPFQLINEKLHLPLRVSLLSVQPRAFKNPSLCIHTYRNIILFNLLFIQHYMYAQQQNLTMSQPKHEVKVDQIT